MLLIVARWWTSVMVSHLCLAGHIACLSMPLLVGECDGWKKQKGLKVSNYDNVVVIQGIFFFPTSPIFWWVGTLSPSMLLLFLLAPFVRATPIAYCLLRASELLLVMVASWVQCKPLSFQILNIVYTNKIHFCLKERKLQRDPDHFVCDSVFIPSVQHLCSVSPSNFQQWLLNIISGSLMKTLNSIKQAIRVCELIK